MSGSYRDVMKCPEGHERVIVRRVSAARRAIVEERRIYSYCTRCRKSYYVTPGEPPKEGRTGVSRYKVVEGSQSAHCCFDFTVVDTANPEMVGGKQWVGVNGPQFVSMCECFYRLDADRICAALNAAETPAVISR